MELYDYIYVDLEMAVSLYSQLTGETIEIRETDNGGTGDQNKKRNYNYKIFKKDSETLNEEVTPHHSFLPQLEEELFQNFHMANVNNGINLRNAADRKLLSEVMCLKVTGRCVIEDYARMKSISKAYPDLISLFNKSLENSAKDSPEYNAVMGRIRELEE